MSDILYWIWLNTILSPGQKAADILLAAFPTAEDLFHASEKEVDKLHIHEDLKEKILRHDLSEAEKIREYCFSNRIGLLPFDSPFFPEKLKQIEKKPFLFYYRGQLPDLNEKICFAMVGTRKATDYGKRNAYTLSYDLARSGGIVVSGLALGIDAFSHQAALDAGGKTVAVLGCGIDIVYPKENLTLFRNIAHFGTILTEYKPGTRPLAFHFPVRNRVISGLSVGTTVVEADMRSGAMITAHLADEQGRDVFAVPGQIGESNSRGTNSLIRDGATIVTRVQDILDKYEKYFPTDLLAARLRAYDPMLDANGFSKVAQPPLFSPSAPLKEEKSERVIIFPDPPPADRTKEPDDLPPFESKPKEPKKAIGYVRYEEEDISLSPPRPDENAELSDLEKKILVKMPSEGGISVDELTADGLPVSEVVTALTLLELKNYISSEPGGRFTKN